METWVHTILGNERWSVHVPSYVNLMEVFKKVLKEYPQDFPNFKTKTENLVFLKLKVPLLYDEEMNNYAVKEEDCIEVSSGTLLKNITPNWDPTKVYFIITLNDKQRTAIKMLRSKYPDIYKRLHVKVDSITVWKERDVELSGGNFIPTGSVPDILKDILEKLRQKRTYHEDENKSVTKKHPIVFDQVFTAIPTTVSATVRNHREFTAFDNVADCYTVYTPTRFAGPHKSSAVKASSFKASFMHFPFFYCDAETSFKYNEEVSWGFPIFLTQGLNEFRRYTPNSCFSITSPDFLCPFLIGEVISIADKQDRHRMLVQAIAAVRVGQYFMKPNGRKFIFFAIYIDSKLIAHRYILYETEECMQDSELRNVAILGEEFDLTNQVRAASFLLEMFNLVEIIRGIAGDLDQDKKRMEYLKNVNQEAKGIRSLHSTQRLKDSAAGAKNRIDKLGPINEGPEDSNTPYSEDGQFVDSEGDHSFDPEDSQSVNSEGGHSFDSEGSQSVNSEGGYSFDSEDIHPFDSERVKALLESRGYYIQYELIGHPHIVMVSEHDKSEISGYLKFVEYESDEADILKYLAKINSSMNHTISPVDIWSAPGGSIISMPVGGKLLIELKDLSKHLWPVFQQLFEAVYFMHNHGIAHMDIKPQNILIPVNYGRLVIIDFSLAMYVDDDKQVRSTNLVGTKGYIAPEVGKRPYNPIRADLWSCGKVVEQFCLYCDLSPTCKQLLEISRLLMDNDPMKRPMMKDVVEMMSL